MKLLLFTITFSVLFLVSCSHSISRYNGGKVEIRSMDVEYKLENNIFKYYSTSTGVMSKQVVLKAGDTTKIKWAGKEYFLHKIDASNMELLGVGRFNLQAEIQTSNPGIYYDNMSLPSYYSNGQPSHYVPAYDYFSFEMPNKTLMWVYKESEEIDVTMTLKTNTNFENNYYIQNGSYIIGQDASGLNHIMVDNNVNGAFGDPEDLILFGKNNPDKKAKKYNGKGVFYLSEKWVTKMDFESNNMLTINCEAETFNYTYLNDSYVNKEEQGVLIFKDLKGKEEVWINGVKYKLKNNRENKIKYGKYKIRIIKNYCEDFETVVEINEKNKTQIVNYLYKPATRVRIYGANRWSALAEPSNNYYVTVSNTNGYNKTYFKTSEINIPNGNFTVTVITAREIKSFNLEGKEGRTIKIDFFDFPNGFVEVIDK